MDNKVALAYLLKMRGTHNLELLKISKSIWHYLLPHGMTITAEYLPNELNVQADWECQNSRDPSDWKLHQSMFQSIIKLFGYPAVKHFVYRLSHQLLQYVAWKPDPNSIATDAMQQCWNKMFPYAFPPFSLISRILKKVRQEKVEQMITVTTTWQTQPWYPLLLEMLMQCSLLLTPLPDLLFDPQGNKHPLAQNRKPMLAAWKVTGNPLRWKEYQAMQPNLYLNQEDWVLLQVTNWPGISGLAGALGKN